MNRETYHIIAEVRDTNGKLITNFLGNKITSIKLESVNIESKDLEIELKHTFADLTALMPQHEITLEASVFNGISETYMVMASYDKERLFIKHD